MIKRGGVRGVGEGLLGIECPSVQRLGLALIGAAADQQACQQGAGAGECLFRVSRRVQATRQRLEHRKCAAIGPLGFLQPPKFALDVAHLLVRAAVFQLHAGIIGDRGR